MVASYALDNFSGSGNVASMLRALSPKVRGFVIVCIGMGVGCGGADADNGGIKVQESRSAVSNGTDETGAPEVVAIVKRRVRCAEPFVESFCSGVLISERVVLTAAHCALVQPALDIEVYVGNAANSGTGRFYAVADQLVHPNYDEVSYDNDLALLQLAESPSVTPVKIGAEGDLVDGSLVNVIGFGGDGNGSDGKKMRGDSVITNIDTKLLRTEPSPSLACGGDSGAPVFFDDASGRHLVGIVRSGDEMCVEYTNATRVSYYWDSFIRPYVDNLPAPTKQAVSLSQNMCSVACESDDQCPRGMLCLPERELGMICGYAELRSGVISTTCEQDSDCDSGLCAASGPGDTGRTCGCFDNCRDLVPAPQSVDTNSLEVGGGCTIARIDQRFGFMGVMPMAVALGMLARRRRHR